MVRTEVNIWRVGLGLHDSVKMQRTIMRKEGKEKGGFKV